MTTIVFDKLQTFLEKSGKLKNWCRQMSDFQAKMHQI